MGKLGTITLDGTKVAANTSKAANRSEETLRKLTALGRACRRGDDADRPRRAHGFPWKSHGRHDMYPERLPRGGVVRRQSG